MSFKISDESKFSSYLVPNQIGKAVGGWGHSETRKSLKEDLHRPIGSLNSYPFWMHTNLQIVKPKLCSSLLQLYSASNHSQPPLGS